MNTKALIHTAVLLSLLVASSLSAEKAIAATPHACEFVEHR
jgi:hypothetical protein